MLQILQESRLTLTELAKQQDVSVSTVWRWVNRGVKGIRLESYSRGGTRCTSNEAYIRFIEATTRAATKRTQENLALPSRTTRHRERDIHRDEKYLDSENC